MSLCEVALQEVLIHNEQWESTALPEHAGPLPCIPWAAPASTAASPPQLSHSLSWLYLHGLSEHSFRVSWLHLCWSFLPQKARHSWSPLRLEQGPIYVSNIYNHRVCA